MVNRTWGRNKAQSYVPYGDSSSLMRVNDATVSTNQLAITGETVAFTAGAAGTTGVVALDVAPVYNATGSELGHFTTVTTDEDSSFAWVTGTVCPNAQQVKWRTDQTDAEQLADMVTVFGVAGKGSFALNYDTGKIRYCKETTGTSDTCNYSTRMMNIDITGSSATGDVDIIAQTLTALKVSATAAANTVSNPIFTSVSATGAANTLGNPMFAQISADGTNAMGATYPLVTSPTAAANTLANPFFARISEDGTNAVGTGYPLQIQLGDGTTQAGVDANSAGLLVKTAGATSYQTYIDTNFLTGETGVVHDVNADLGRNGIDGYIVCDGPGNISVQISDVGAVSGEDAIVLESGETFDLAGLSVDNIKIAWVADSAYRIMAL